MCAGRQSLTCIDEATPDCDGSEPACTADGTALKLCHDNGGAPGYVVVEPCSAGDICYDGTIFDFCAPPGAFSCDDATTPRTCSVDGSAIEDCYNGWTRETSCALCPDAVSCRCDEVASIGNLYDCSESFAVDCIPQGAPDCDVVNDPDTCIGDVAHRCIGHWEDVDCGAQGMVCGVGEGIAGCRAANAPTCDAVVPTCDGDVIVQCCECGSIFGAFLDVPCVPGYEARFDCTSPQFGIGCEQTFPFPPACH